MKKVFFSLILTIIMAVGMMPTGSAFVPATSEQVEVLLNDEYIQFDQSPVIINGRTLVPIRAVCEALGADVYWHDVGKGIIIVKNEIKLFLTIGENSLQKMTVTDFSELLECIENADDNFIDDIKLDVSPQIINNRTVLPIRAVCEALGAEIDWDEKNNTVVITCSKELISKKNQDTKFFDSYIAFAESAEARGEKWNIAYDNTTIITMSGFSNLDEYNDVIAFIQSKIDSMELDLYYNMDLSKENVITITVNYDDGINIEEFVESITKEAKIYFTDEEDNIILDKTDIIDVKAFWNHEMQCYVVGITLTKEGRAKFAEATEKILENTVGIKRILILFDDCVISAPTFAEKIDTNEFIITGDFSSETADSFSRYIRAKDLPKNVKVEVNTSP